MKIKRSVLIIGLLIVGSIHLNAQEERIIKKEAKYYCQCYKSFNKQIKKIEKKTKRKEKRASKYKKYKPGMKLFGGEELVLNLEDCLNKKRSRKMKDYMESLDDKEEEIFRRKVESLVKKKCFEESSSY